MYRDLLDQVSPIVSAEIGNAVGHVLLLEIDLGAMLLQFPDGGGRIHRVPGKAADRLGDDEVDSSSQSV